ncbi:MAG: UDP-glucose 6-dehydrogenase, partial [Acidimicrobiales bacterium]|nr:UDP-glucose 6-dehydrogenase [Acidimicrobiales bacterium]
IAEDAGYDFALMRGVIQANDEQFDRIVRKVESVTSLDGATVGVLGIAFKAGTDDTRESPAIEVMKRLLAKGAMVKAYDPAVTSLNLDGVDVVGNAYAACEGASAIVVATEWNEFTLLDFDRVGTLVAERNMIDARNLLDRDALTKRGFTYQGVGRS